MRIKGLRRPIFWIAIGVMLLGAAAPWVGDSINTTAAQTAPESIWASSAKPKVVTDNDTAAVELGVKFRADVSGKITGVRFYKGPLNTGTHTGSLWTTSGTLLARATFTNESSSGWQQVTFSTPVNVTANTVYVASYHTTKGRYSVDENGFRNAGVDRGNLHALRDGVSGGNGVYRYGSQPGFPTQTWRASNYWVDVLFVASGTSTPNPTPTKTPSATSTPLATNTPSPTNTPSTPGGETPVAGQTCPAWVHDQKVATGPDGKSYPTWHPAVDQQYGCYFRHEHGSNPNKVPGASMPLYGMGTPEDMTESHYGIKTKAIYAENGVKILATTHFGTAEPQKAVCQRYHHVNFQFTQNDQLVADVTFMADFGAAVKNDTLAPLDRACADPETGVMKTQAQIDKESNGARLNPVGTGGPFYYPWRMDDAGVDTTIGFQAYGFTVNTPTVVAACADMKCNERVMINGTGIWAFASAATGWGIRAGANTGTFYTNHYGKTVVSADTPGAVRQFVKPGVDIRLTDLSAPHSYFPDKRYGGTYGDYVYTQLHSSDPNIMGNVPAVVNPGNVVQGNN